MKLNMMKIVAILIWVLGLPASLFLASHRFLSSSFDGGHFKGYLILFFALGFIVYQLAIVIEKLSKKTDAKKQEIDKSE